MHNKKPKRIRRLNVATKIGLALIAPSLIAPSLLCVAAACQAATPTQQQSNIKTAQENAAQESNRASPAPTSVPGIAIGETLPAITLRKQDGTEVSVADLLKNGPIALVFYRSANWCAFCKRQLTQLQSDQEKFKNINLQIVGISYDNVDNLKAFAHQKSITFPLLSDEGSQVIRQLNLEIKKGLPHPGTIVVDQKGVVRGKIFKEGHTKRHTNQELLNLLQTLDLDAVQQKTEPGKGGKSDEGGDK